MTDKVPTKFTSTVLKYGWFFVHRYIHITYIQSYYMMVNKDIVCLQKIQEEKNEIDQIYRFFFQFPQTFFNLFQLFYRKINYFKLADTDYSQIHPNWTVEMLKYFGVFLPSWWISWGSRREKVFVIIVDNVETLSQHKILVNN